ncbi:hypothetical protein DFJ74DRAFT_655424 [Hyaloraphidium curvatum]|nr:hypothetical protein DFJ74DRAFT_655424 [Hyaloraphidium curvatum]
MRFGTLVGRRAPRSAQLDMGPRPLVRSAGSRTVVRAAGLVVQTRGYKFKLKTHKGTAKRFKPLAKGAFKRWQPGAHHLKRKLRLTRRREKRRAVLVTNATQRRKLRRLMPYA